MLHKLYLLSEIIGRIVFKMPIGGKALCLQGGRERMLGMILGSPVAQMPDEGLGGGQERLSGRDRLIEVGIAFEEVK